MHSQNGISLSRTEPNPGIDRDTLGREGGEGGREGGRWERNGGGGGRGEGGRGREGEGERKVGPRSKKNSRMKEWKDYIA